jgi:hypothetical protein
VGYEQEKYQSAYGGDLILFGPAARNFDSALSSVERWL